MDKSILGSGEGTEFKPGVFDDNGNPPKEVKDIKFSKEPTLSEYCQDLADTTTPENLSIIPSNETDLTVFVEDMTPEKLEIIKTEIETLPAVVDNKTYLKTFDMHQVVKSIRRLTKKSVLAKIKEWKTEFDNKKIILNSDHEKMLKVLGPMEADLDEKRKWWDMLLDAYKMNAAHDEAKAQQQEWFRIHLIGLHTSALIDNDQFDIDKQQEKEAKELEAANDVLEQERLKLEREKYEFECDKTRLDFIPALIEACRLNFNDAWEEAHQDWPDEKPMTVAEIRKTELYKKVKTTSEENCHYNGFEPVKQFGPCADGECISSVPISNIDEKLDSYEKDLTPENDKNWADSEMLQLINNAIQGNIDYLKSQWISDPKKQQKLKNFILSTEINFNTFKKAVDCE